jgi:hypothetical protein
MGSGAKDFLEKKKMEIQEEKERKIKKEEAALPKTFKK